MDEPLRTALDAWIAGRPDPKPSRSAAIRALLREVLGGKGLMESESPAPLAHQIAVLEVDLARIPQLGEASPAAALHTMDRALAEDALVRLQNEQNAETVDKRKRAPRRLAKRAAPVSSQG